jgi:hypothetical protein
VDFESATLTIPASRTPNDTLLIRGALADLDAYADPLLAVLRSVDDGAGGVFDLLRSVLCAAVSRGPWTRFAHQRLRRQKALRQNRAAPAAGLIAPFQNFY